MTGKLRRLDEPEKAAQITGASESHLADTGFTCRASYYVEIDQYKAYIVGPLGRATFFKVCSKGKTLSIEHIMGLAKGGRVIHNSLIHNLNCQ